MNNKPTGAIGEDLAVKYLKKKGYAILDRNFFFGAGGAPKIAEIDIIAKKNRTVVFVEVKTLKKISGSPFLASDKVNGEKLKKIAMAAEVWLTKRRMPLNCQQQIDVIAVELQKDERPKIVRWLFGPKARLSHFENVEV